VQQHITSEVEIFVACT